MNSLRTDNQPGGAGRLQGQYRMLVTRLRCTTTATDLWPAPPAPASGQRVIMSIRLADSSDAPGLGSRQTPLKAAAVLPAGQRGGSPSGRNQSLLSGGGGDPGWVDASDRLGSAGTASSSWSLIGSRSTRSSWRCPASVSVTTSVTR
jgi:hypothetical protein